MATQTKNNPDDRPPSKLLRYGLTNVCVFVWSCIEYPYSMLWFLGMMLVSMKNSDEPNEDEPCDITDVPESNANAKFDEWIAHVAELQAQPKKERACDRR